MMMTNQEKLNYIYGNNEPCPVYQAQKPLTPWQDTLFKVVVRMLFPPILVWDLISLGLSKLFGRKIGRMILWAQRSPVKDKILDKVDLSGIHVEHFYVRTWDGAMLDGIEVKDTSQDNRDNPDADKVLVILGGRKARYENLLPEIIRDARMLGCTVVGFNLRGVGKSTGIPLSRDDLVTDGFSQVDRLLKKGVSSENIMLKGHSLGGALTARIGRYFDRIKMPIYILIGRSFSNITDYLIAHTPGLHVTWKRRLLEWIAKPFLKLGLIGTNWEMDTLDDFIKIDEDHKEYFAARSRDKVMLPYACLYKALKPHRKKEKQKIDSEIERLEREIIESASPETEAQNRIKIASLKERRNHFKNRKMDADQNITNTHDIPLDELINRHGHTAESFFHGFFRRAGRAKPDVQIRARMHSPG